MHVRNNSQQLNGNKLNVHNLEVNPALKWKQYLNTTTIIYNKLGKECNTGIYNNTVSHVSSELVCKLVK